MHPHEKGWFKIPGIREHGDRSIEEQSIGLDRALSEAEGKTVLDLGCAEGAISKQFALAGASKVLGIELLGRHLEVARRWCKETPQVSFVKAHLADYAAERPEPEQFDIVLALGIIHKLQHPKVGLLFAARSCRSLLLFRAPARATDGVVRSKHFEHTVNVPATLTSMGFREELLVPGVRGEAVQYWRRIS